MSAEPKKSKMFGVGWLWSWQIVSILRVVASHSVAASIATSAFLRSPVRPISLNSTSCKRSSTDKYGTERGLINDRLLTQLLYLFKNNLRSHSSPFKRLIYWLDYLQHGDVFLTPVKIRRTNFLGQRPRRSPDTRYLRSQYESKVQFSG